MTKTTPLLESEIQDRLKDFSGWVYADNKISKEFQFEDFSQAVGFVSSIADKFNAMDHHPDVHIFYNKIRFDLQRFDIGGKVTDLDFKAARIIEENYKSLAV